MHRHKPGSAASSVGLALGALAAFAAPAHAQGTPIFTEDQKILASDGGQGELFGYSTGVSGDWMVVGAPYAQAKIGAAYIYRYDGTGWGEEVKINHPEPAYEGVFGGSVDIYGDAAVVCSRYDSNPDDGQGAAYVYRYNGAAWVLEDKLVAYDLDDEIYFGKSVAIYDDVIVVGAHGDSGPYDIVGAAYVFRHDGAEWTFEARLVGSTAAYYQSLGWDVGIDEDLIIIGQNPSMISCDMNRVFIFRFSGVEWVEEAVLSTEPEVESWYGRTVDIIARPEGDLAVVSAADDGWELYRGKVYVYRYNGTWTEHAVLESSDLQNYDYFSEPVVFADQGTIIALAGGHDIDGHGQGALYVFREVDEIWTETARLATSDPGDWFGYLAAATLSADTRHVAIGAPKEDNPNGFDAGSVFYYSLSCAEDLNGDGYVGQSDLGILLASYEVGDGGDIDGDGMTGQADLGLLLAAYETWCK